MCGNGIGLEASEVGIQVFEFSDQGSALSIKEPAGGEYWPDPQFLGFSIWSSGLRVQSSAIRVQESKNEELGTRYGLGSGFQSSGFGYKDWS